MLDFGRFVARGGQIHSAGGRLHGVASSVSSAARLQTERRKKIVTSD